MKKNEERLQDILEYLDSLTRIHPSDIPDINLYMDQVTTFMDDRLAGYKVPKTIEIRDTLPRNASGKPSICSTLKTVYPFMKGISFSSASPVSSLVSVRFKLLA